VVVGFWPVIVNALLAREDSVSVLDVVQCYHDVPFYSGDITEQVSISDALSKVGVDALCFSWCVLFKGFFRAARRVSFIPLLHLMGWTMMLYIGRSMSKAHQLS
jgi:hypothetical protein